MDEQLRILKMIEEGTITAEQASELMNAMGVNEEMTMARDTYDKKIFRVVVDSVTGDKVNVQFPVGAIKKLLRATGRLPISDQSLEGVDISTMMEAISECLEDEIEGDFVNVKAADGTTIRVFVD